MGYLQVPKMAGKALTTEGLRTELFSAIEAVRDERMTPSQAGAISKLADQMLKSAQLEMDYTEHLLALDNSGAELAAGPMLLTSKK